MEENKNTKILVPVVIFFLILGSLLGYLFWKMAWPRLQKAPPPTQSGINQPLPPTEALVTITQDGFQPATLSIPRGSQVTWINKDEQLHQIASDPHPTHALLPTLFADEPLSFNSSFTFTFEKEGTFTYHDELNPLKLQGTIIVK